MIVSFKSLLLESGKWPWIFAYKITHNALNILSMIKTGDLIGQLKAVAPVASKWLFVNLSVFNVLLRALESNRSTASHGGYMKLSKTPRKQSSNSFHSCFVDKLQLCSISCKESSLYHNGPASWMTFRKVLCFPFCFAIMQLLSIIIWTMHQKSFFMTPDDLTFRAGIQSEWSWAHASCRCKWFSVICTRSFIRQHLSLGPECKLCLICPPPFGALVNILGFRAFISWFLGSLVQWHLYISG